jgi:hypothetical protein
MDVDNVTMGAGGKAAVPRDHNRDWNDEPVYPEVRAAQRQILELEGQRRFDVFIDLHNPGASDRRPFFFGPRIRTVPSVQQRNYVRWLAIARGLMDQLEPDYRFTSYVKTQEELNQMSSNWVRNHTSKHVVSVTLETAWNRPEGTPEGYEKVGRQLGEALAEYLTTNPRRD